MMVFFVFLFVIVVIYFWTLTWTDTKEKEGFVADKEAHPAKTTDAKKDTVKPSELPGTLPTAPYLQLAAQSPLPYQDTTMIKANRQQLTTLLELLKGFLSFEAQEADVKGDPSVQLPLQTARSDLSVIQAEVDVLQRNPGIQSSLTLSQVNEMAANLAYLQREVRLQGSAGSMQDVIENAAQEMAGSRGAAASGNSRGGASRLEEFRRSLQPTALSATALSDTALYEGFVDATVGATGTAGTTGSQPMATLEDLKNLIARAQGEIQRLAASGTTDPTVQARIRALEGMKAEVQEIVTKVESGAMKPTEIPIQKADVEKALPILGKPSEPLPKLLKAFQLPAGFANLLPSSLQNDPASMQMISTLMDKYGDTIANGIRATFSVTYEPPTIDGSPMNKATMQGTPQKQQHKQERARAKASTIETTGFPSAADLDNVSNAKFQPWDSGRPVTDQLALIPQDAGRGPARFDWKERAQAIEDQVRKRGLDPVDYGILPSTGQRSKTFSWKGYAKMICTRLQATMDPGLPEACGCPPMDWKGWRG